MEAKSIGPTVKKRRKWGKIKYCETKQNGWYLLRKPAIIRYDATEDDNSVISADLENVRQGHNP